jgi:hypothetical protein
MAVLLGGRPAPVTSGLVFAVDAAHANSDGSYGNTSNWYDYVGKNNSSFSGFAYTDPSGWNGSGREDTYSFLAFAGDNDIVSFGDLASLDLGTWSRSISVWVKPSAVPSVAGVIFSKMSSSAPFTGWDIYINSSLGISCDLIQNYASNYMRNCSTGQVINLGTWMHIVATYAASGNWQVYVNGGAVTTTNTGSSGDWNADNTNSAALGIRDPSSPAYPFQGGISSLKIYNRALSADEAKQEYDSTKPRIVRRGLIFEVDARRATAIGGPGTNSPTVSTWDERIQNNTGSLSGHAMTVSSGWAGDGTTFTPYRLVNDGSGDYVSFGDLSTLDLGSGPRTISTWCSLTSLPGAGNYSMIFAKRSETSPAYRGWALYYIGSGSTWAFLVMNTGVAQATGGTTTAGAGHHITGVYDGTNISIYQNGVLMNTNNGGSGSYDSDNDRAASLGVEDPTGTPFAYQNGWISCVQIYNVGLTSGEVLQNYLAGIDYYWRHNTIR